MDRKLLTVTALVIGVAVAGSGLAVAQQASSAPDAAAACKGRQFIAYFPSGSADTTSAQSVVGMAVQFAGPSAALIVTGHADGAEDELVALTRSNAITQVLVGAGIARSRITVNSAFATAPAVATSGPEPLNRRATICVQPA